MNTYTSKTGYVKTLNGEYLTADTIYLGIYDSADNYVDITKDEYDLYIKEQNNDNRQDDNRFNL